MARLFNGTSDYGTFDGVGSFATWVKNRPWALSVTFYTVRAVTNRQAVFGDWSAAGSSQSIGLTIGSSSSPSGAALTLVVPTTVVGIGQVDLGVTAVASRWYTVTAYWDGTTYGASVNGVSIAPGSTSAWGSGTTLTLGRAGAFNGLYFGGHICDFAVWSLGGYSGVRRLARGIQPPRVTRENLHFYAPLVGFGREATYGRLGDRSPQNLTWSGTSAANDRFGFRQLSRNAEAVFA